MTLDDYITECGSASASAALFQISPAQLSRIRKGVSRASWQLACRIETVTGGQVTAVAVMNLQPASCGADCQKSQIGASRNRGPDFADKSAASETPEQPA